MNEDTMHKDKQASDTGERWQPAPVAFNQGRGIARLWGGWFIAAAGWLLHLLGGYFLVEWYCFSGASMSPSAFNLLLHGLTAVSLLLALGGLALGWKNHRDLRGQEEQAGDDDLGLTRSHFLVLGGLVFSTALSVLILMQGWANFVLEPCQ